MKKAATLEDASKEFRRLNMTAFVTMALASTSAGIWLWLVQVHSAGILQKF